MCNEANNKDGCKCIAEILKVILILQRKANCSGDTCLDTCDKGFLGCSPTCLECNTRPVMLYTACGNGLPWEMPTTKTNTVCGGPVTETNCPNVCSNVFRIEKLDGCCATFRVLSKNNEPENCKKFPYVATNSFFTMDLNCCCAIRCLPDTFVDCV